MIINLKIKVRKNIIKANLTKIIKIKFQKIIKLAITNKIKMRCYKN